MEKEKKYELLGRLRYDRTWRGKKWEEYYDCWTKIDEFFDGLDASDDKDEVYKCILHMDKFIEFLINKILKLEEAMADFHDTVNENSPYPDGDGGGCKGRPGSPVL
jgi:hypothetical protein